MFAEQIEDTIEIANYGTDHNLNGHCYAITYEEHYVGIILIGQAIEDEADPAELKGNPYFRVIGFVIDQRYRSLGIGSRALRMALENIYHDYGDVPILLECHKDNKSAMAFYEKAGFKHTNCLHHEDYYFILHGAKA